MTRIESFGWHGGEREGIARVVSAHGDYYHIVCNEAEGEILARRKKSVFAGKASKATFRSSMGLETVGRGEDAPVRPMTGDFVRFRHNDRGESLITELLPRFSSFERRDANARRKCQTLAVNFDWLFIMTSMNADFSFPRLDRFMALAADIGDAKAAILLTKTDLVPPGRVEERAAECRRRFGVAVFPVSSKTGDGIDAIRELAEPGVTLAFIGSSGVGKSTLLNTLAGEEWAATQEIQEWSGKGRHTTTSRELAMLPCGAMIVDTPGIREIGMIGETDELQVRGESSHRWRK